MECKINILEQPAQKVKFRLLPSGDMMRIILNLYFMGTNLVSAQLENFFRWNPSGTFRNIPWYH